MEEEIIKRSESGTLMYWHDGEPIRAVTIKDLLNEILAEMKKWKKNLI